MSDMSQGPGWWLASNGKWYPPEQYPGAGGGSAPAYGSSQAEGPGWWLASDGRWYPPDLHPGGDTLVQPEGAQQPQSAEWWLASDGRWYPPQLHPDVIAASSREVTETPVQTDVSTGVPEVPPEPVPEAEPGPESVAEAAPEPDREPLIESVFAASAAAEDEIAAAAPAEDKPQRRRRRRRRGAEVTASPEAESPEAEPEPVAEAAPEPTWEPLIESVFAATGDEVSSAAPAEDKPQRKRRRRRRGAEVTASPEAEGTPEPVAEAEVAPEAAPAPEPVARAIPEVEVVPGVEVEPALDVEPGPEPVAEATPEPDQEPLTEPVSAASAAAEAEDERAAAVPAEDKPQRRRRRRRRGAEVTASPEIEVAPEAELAPQAEVAQELPEVGAVAGLEPEVDEAAPAPEMEPHTVPAPGPSIADGPATTEAAPGVGAGEVQQQGRGRRVLEVVAVLAVIGLAVGLIVAFTSGTTPSHPARTQTTGKPPAASTIPATVSWSDPSMHVLSQPVAASGRVLVLTASPSGGMALAAVDPRTGATAWHVPFSPSAVPPGVPIAPVTDGNVALALEPASGPTDSPVLLEGIDLSSGKQVWASSSPVTVVDAPMLCASGGAFCLTTSAPGGGTQLEVISPSTGSVTATVPGPETEMAAGLYATSDSPASLQAVSSSGRTLWTKSIASVFGDAGYSTAYGWNFVNAGSLDVGTIGVTPSGSSEPLASLKTLGISTADGTVSWSIPGALQCFGVVPVTPPFACRYSGSATYVNGRLSASGLGLTLVGFDESTGTVRWTAPLASVRAMATGTGVPILDATHIVVQLTSGASLLDLENGQTSAAPVGEALWCGQAQSTNLTGPASALSAGQRVTATLYTPCTAQGTPTSAIPAHAVAGIGAEVDGVFVWGSPRGLEASSTPR